MDGEPRAATLTFTQLPSSEQNDDDDDVVMLNVLRCRLTYQGQAVTNAEAWFNKP